MTSADCPRLDPPAHLSVVIPTRDRAALLGAALASVRAVAGPDLKIEIIVVDDGSTDDTVATAARYTDHIIPSVGHGSSAARNTGAAVATGEFVTFLDDDDLWTAEHARRHIQLLRDRPELGAVVGQIVNVSEDLATRGQPWPASLPADGDLFAAFFQYYPQIGGTIVRKTVLEVVGDSDPALWGDQDWDWHLRLALVAPVGFVRVPSVLFRQRPISADGERLEWLRLRDMYRVFWRNLRRGRAAGRAPAASLLATSLLDHLGAYSGYFANCGADYAERGERRAALRAIMRAFLASPPHAIAGAIRRRPMRRALAALLRRPSARASTRDEASVAVTSQPTRPS